MADEQNGTTTDAQNGYRIGDPVMDKAQGRPMVVLDAPDQSVSQWSDANGYDLESNYANGKFDTDPNEPVVECVYVSDVRSEPSKSYTFPVSRVCLIDAHHADEGPRIADRVSRELLAKMFAEAAGDGSTEFVAAVASDAGIDPETIQVAREVASVEREVVADE